MNYITILLFIFSAVVVGCKDKEKEVIYQKSKPVKEYVKLKQENEKLDVFEDQIVSEDIFAVDVRPKDKVILVVKGMKYTPEFDNSIVKTGTVTWTESECLGLPSSCFKFPRKGSCKLGYSERLKDNAESLSLISEARHSFRVYIGDEKIDLGTPKVKDEDTFEFEFTVTPEMVENSDEMYVRILPPSDTKVVRTGYTGTIDCPQSTKPDFKVHYDTSYEDETYSSYEEFSVSLRVEY